MTQSASTTGSSTIQGIPTFSVSDILPKKPFYTYTSTDNIITSIVFDLSNSINISSDAFLIILNIPYELSSTSQTISISDISINSTGPISTTSDDIYIDCQPVGVDKVEEVLVPIQGGGISIMSIVSSDSFIFIISIIGLITILGILYYGITKIKYQNQNKT